ncbi:MAG: CoA pyrophosphatase [Porticoccaceae bacterium]|jgi:8-oxo-dGTP pyrophosphatase MutT (NUDIX family)|nr:CoA pyrophosphatase [Porticoccaceae bacterium]
MLETIKNRLKNFPLQRHQPSPQERGSTAAVLVALHGDNEDPQVILTQRAFHLNNHAGEVAFPGGMWDETDTDLLHTALREAHEEIGLLPSLVESIATLPVATPKRRSLNVTPFVGLVDSSLDLVADPGEIGALFDVPLRHFMNIDDYDYFEMKTEQGALSFPFLSYNGYKIWGFTLKVLTDMLNATLDANIHLNYPSHERIEEMRQRAELEKATELKQREQ